MHPPECEIEGDREIASLQTDVNTSHGIIFCHCWECNPPERFFHTECACRPQCCISSGKRSAKPQRRRPWRRRTQSSELASRVLMRSASTLCNRSVFGASRLLHEAQSWLSPKDHNHHKRRVQYSDAARRLPVQYRPV